MDSENEKLPKKISKIYEMFIGTHVNIVLKDVRMSDSQDRSSNMAVGGIFLDEDEEWVYLGTVNEVNTALKKDVIAAVFAESVELEDAFAKPPGTIEQ